MTDLDLLELENDFTLNELKKSYRKKSKQFHPDINKDSLISHLAMIRLNQAYQNLMKKCSAEKVIQGEEPSEKEDEYDIYKSGISLFQSIHPSKWKKINKDGIDNVHSIETDPDIINILDDLIARMAKAYHCFSLIVSEYPYSCWAGDSRKKLADIEKMTVRYAKIKQSYVKDISRQNPGKKKAD